MFKKIIGIGFSTKGKKAKDVEKYIQNLIESGANEFFTGYNPPYWYQKFGFEVSPNGRFSEHEQITDFETLQSITQEIHKYGCELFVNLNAWYYTDITFPYIKKMVDEFILLGIDGIICGNISILEYLESIHYTGKINISTIMSVYNTQAIQFFLDNYKINKIILSREITLKEIENIVTHFPNMQFEVFGEGDFCRYNNGLCFAEHKYSSRDICTVVVNDLIIKNKFRSDFKKYILNTPLPDEEKIKYFDDTFQDIFEKIRDILSRIDLGIEEKSFLEHELFLIYIFSKKRVDLFFDAMKGPNDEKNKKILIYFQGLKYILIHYNIEDAIHQIELYTLKEYLESSIKTGMEYFVLKLKNIGGYPKLKASELGIFYSKGDNLNLYSYLFFSKFPNIVTVKFPTRGRNYNEKLHIIEEVIKKQEVDDTFLDRGMSIERSHYDLKYLFEDKGWFRNMMKDKKF